MKPGKVAAARTRSAASCESSRRTLSAGKRLTAFIVLLTWGLAQLACSGGFITPAQMTATAVSGKGVVAGVGQTAGTPAAVANVNPQEMPAGSPSQTPTATVQPTATAQAVQATPKTTQDPPILYYTQAGDTLKALAARFDVRAEEITSPEKITQEGLFDPGVLLLIPRRLGEVSSSTPLIPDSEVVFSPSALDFDIKKFVKESGGYLSTFKEWRSDGWYDGAGIIYRVAIENSINPRLLLAVLEQQSHWVYGQPTNLAQTDYPIGFLKNENEKKGLYYQLSWAVQQLNTGYYGWRDGSVTELTFPDGKKLRLAPDLNAGTVGLLYLFSRLYTQPQWAGILYGQDGMMPKYENSFGNPWIRAQTVEPLFPATLTQPPLALPFPIGHMWSLTGGPHSAWVHGDAWAAIDLAPGTTVHGCYESDEWITASASGLVVRSENGLVMVDLDGDGYEQTGWVIMYMHVATNDRVPVGTWVDLNEHIGHPSCEGGVATGTHVHIARKYNGEWIMADGPMPFVLSGWRVHQGDAQYKGTMTKGGETIYASQVGSYESRITRPEESTP